MVSPTGSFSDMTSLIPAIIPSIFSSVTTRRFTIASVSCPFLKASLASAMSRPLASRILLLLASRASAMASSALFFASVVSASRPKETFFALMTSGMISMLVPTAVYLLICC